MEGGFLVASRVAGSWAGPFEEKRPGRIAEMVMEREIQELIARCVGIMVYYHNSERCEASSRRMAAEVGAVARLVAGMGLSEGGMERLLRPVSDQLIARYGHELGPRLNAEFFAAFDGPFAAGAVPEKAGPHGHPLHPEKRANP